MTTSATVQPNPTKRRSSWLCAGRSGTREPEHGVCLPDLTRLEYNRGKGRLVWAIREMLSFKTKASAPCNRHATLPHRIVAQIVPGVEMHGRLLRIKVDGPTRGGVIGRGIRGTHAGPTAISIRLNAQHPCAAMTSPCTGVPQCHVVVIARCDLELFVVLLDVSSDLLRDPEIERGVLHT